MANMLRMNKQMKNILNKRNIGRIDSQTKLERLNSGLS